MHPLRISSRIHAFSVGEEGTSRIVIDVKRNKAKVNQAKIKNTGKERKAEITAVVAAHIT